jgi:hypothetical protein
MAAAGKGRTISAQILLRPAAGARLADAEITAANVERLRPAIEAADRVRRFFAGAGFEVGDLVGNSFAVSGPMSRFERVFGHPVEGDESGLGWRRQGGEVTLELPPEAIPREVAEHVTVVTFTPPPDFGPGTFGGEEGFSR